jgi:hypothetical protein
VKSYGPPATCVIFALVFIAVGTVTVALAALFLIVLAWTSAVYIHSVRMQFRDWWRHDDGRDT